MIHTRLTSTNFDLGALRDVCHTIGWALVEVDQSLGITEFDLRVFGPLVNFYERGSQAPRLVDAKLPRRAENAVTAATAASTSTTTATVSGQFTENALAASAKAWTPAT